MQKKNHKALFGVMIHVIPMNLYSWLWKRHVTSKAHLLLFKIIF